MKTYVKLTAKAGRYAVGTRLEVVGTLAHNGHPDVLVLSDGERKSHIHKQWTTAA